MTKPIHFFMPDKPYGWLCALSPQPVTIDGVAWPTAEHFYQAQKFEFHPVIQQHILQEPDPFQAKAIAQEHKNLRVKDWKPLRCRAVFHRAMDAKFKQHPDLAAQLVATGNAALIEANDDDAFWGHGPDGNGENWCGKILMDVRERLK